MFLSFALLSIYLLLGLFKVDKLVRLGHLFIAFLLLSPHKPQLELFLFPPQEFVFERAHRVAELDLFARRQIPELVVGAPVLSVRVGQDLLVH